MIKLNEFESTLPELCLLFKGRIYKDLESLLAKCNGVYPEDIHLVKLMYIYENNNFVPLVYEDPHTTLDISY